MTTPSALLAYDGCGLDWVFLASGFAIHETPYGRGVAIQDANSLHELVLREIIMSPHPIRGQELRFIRSMLGLSQEDMGKITGIPSPQITRMEANRRKPIMPSADRVIRMFFVLQQRDRALEDRILELLDQFDEQEHERTTFAPSDYGWMRAA